MGAFIVIEGIDGTGKTTVCREAAEVLRSEGREVEVTFEPTDTGVGALIRSGAAGTVSQRAESLMFVADRYEHTDRIAASVAAGRVVICDRYYASTIAYQSASLDGDSVDVGWLESLSEPFVRMPDAVILLDMDPSEAMARVGSRGEAESKFEDVRFLAQVRDRYLELADRYGFEMVDASRSREDVLRDVMTIVREIL